MQIEHEAATGVLYLLAVRRTWIPVTDSRKGYHATRVRLALVLRFDVQWSAFQREETANRMRKVYIGVRIQGTRRFFKSVSSVLSTNGMVIKFFSVRTNRCIAFYGFQEFLFGRRDVFFRATVCRENILDN